MLDPDIEIAGQLVDADARLDGLEEMKKANDPKAVEYLFMVGVPWIFFQPAY